MNFLKKDWADVANEPVDVELWDQDWDDDALDDEFSIQLRYLDILRFSKLTLVGKNCRNWDRHRDFENEMVEFMEMNWMYLLHLGFW